ncbi:MAG: hypothetical protein QM776_18310 [Rhodocyclaceae bacterium]
MKNMISTLALLLLGGCASFTYVEPKSGPVATITIRTLAPHFNIGVVAYSGNIEAESEGDSIGILNSGIPGVPKSSELTVRISASQNFRFSTKISNTDLKGIIPVPGVGVFIATNASLCKTHTEFKPREGGRYLALHKDLPGGGCQMDVFEVGQDGQNQKVDVLTKDFCVDPKLDGHGFVSSGKYRVCKYYK